MTKLKRIAVFCGSNLGQSRRYQQSARDVGQALSRHNKTLIYGGGSVGLMGVIADTLLEQKGEVIGVIPELMASTEVAHQGLSELIIASTMHERKATMASLADGFMLLPGGAGSLDEFFEILTWRKLGLHDKPCAILNHEGYYDKLLQFIDHAVSEGFMQQAHRDMILVGDDSYELVAGMDRCVSTSEAVGGCV